VLMNRGMMGDGRIDLPTIRAEVERAGYHGVVEVEIFNHAIWAMPLDDVLALTKLRFSECS